MEQGQMGMEGTSGRTSTNLMEGRFVSKGNKGQPVLLCQDVLIVEEKADAVLVAAS